MLIGHLMKWLAVDDYDIDRDDSDVDLILNNLK